MQTAAALTLSLVKPNRARFTQIAAALALPLLKPNTNTRGLLNPCFTRGFAAFSKPCPPPSASLESQWFPPIDEEGKSRVVAFEEKEFILMKKKFEEWAVESGEDESIAKMFKEWMLQHRRIYGDANEMQNRYLVFKTLFLEYGGNVSLKLKPYADMTPDEFQEIFGRGFTLAPPPSIPGWVRRREPTSHP